jgi:hypothetical protein
VIGPGFICGCDGFSSLRKKAKAGAASGAPTNGKEKRRFLVGSSSVPIDRDAKSANDGDVREVGKKRKSKPPPFAAKDAAPARTATAPAKKMQIPRPILVGSSSVPIDRDAKSANDGDVREVGKNRKSKSAPFAAKDAAPARTTTTPTKKMQIPRPIRRIVLGMTAALFVRKSQKRARQAAPLRTATTRTQILRKCWRRGC